MLELEKVGKRVGTDWHIHDVGMTFARGTLIVLLGPRQTEGQARETRRIRARRSPVRN